MASGGNRYELLFMDEDAGEAAPIDVKKKQDNTSKRAKTNENGPAVEKKKTPTPAVNKKPTPQAEKENKSSALNKNNAASNNNQTVGTKVRTNTNTTEGIGRNRSQNEVSRNTNPGFNAGNDDRGGDQRNNRRDVRQGGFGGNGGAPVEGGNGQVRAQRTFRDRENQRPQRYRNDFGTRGGKREFDRQSGSDKTGVKSIDKRDGAGAHNWGSVKQEIDDINKSAMVSGAAIIDKEETNNESTVEQTGEQTVEQQQQQPTTEAEESKEMTLDEWKALSQQRAKPQYNIRQPGEGEDTSQWKKMVVLNKKKENDSEDELEYDPSMYPQRVGRLQRIVDIQFKFNDARRSGPRGRGPRPGGDKPRFEGARNEGFRQNQGRPNPNFGEDRQQRTGTSMLKVDDERQFPTLN